VAETCEFLGSELADFLLVRDAILLEFDYDKDLLAYIDVIETVIDGHNEIYGDSKRHMACGQVKVTR